MKEAALSRPFDSHRTVWNPTDGEPNLAFTGNSWATSCGVMRKRPIPHSFEEQLAFQKRRLEERAMHLPDGSSKDDVLKKIAQLNAAIHINEWLRSPGLQPPN